MNTLPPELRQQGFIWFAAIATTLAWVLCVIAVLEHSFTQSGIQLRTETEDRLARHLETVVWGIDRSLDTRLGVPQALAQEPRTTAALERLISTDLSSVPSEARKRLWSRDPLLARTNRHLEDMAHELKFSALWIMNAEGDIIASSNAEDPVSFIGANVADLGYFQEAQDGRFGYQYAQGHVSEIPGLYFSAPVRLNGRFLGAIAGKLDLSELDAWISQGDIFLTDAHGTIILAKDEGLRMHVLPGQDFARLDAQQRLAIYGRKTLPEVSIAPWGDPRYPGLKRLGTDETPLILMAKPLRHAGLTAYALHHLPQLLDQDHHRRYETVLISLLGMLAIGILALTTDYVAKINRYSNSLKVWREGSAAETELAMHVMSRLTTTQGLRDPMVQHFNLPAEHFSGDLLCAARAPGDILNVMLADATGHGLPAALTAMPLPQIFYNMTAKGFHLSTIAAELNKRLKAILPADRFVAATLASVDVHNQTIEVWNGGGPDALFVDQEGTLAAQWPSRYLPLGILPEDNFQALTETILYQHPGALVIYSDGLIEAESPSSEAFGFERLKQLLHGRAEPAERYDRLLEETKRHLRADHGHDDISCLVVQIPVERRRCIRCNAPFAVSRAAVEDWRLEITYSAQELRYVDVVPALLSFITQIPILKSHQGPLFLIISELFHNALDYGLLGLDSSVKGRIGGFEYYMQERESRLKRMRNGQIRFEFQIHTLSHQAVVDIAVKDTGPGFDFTLLDAPQTPEEMLARMTRPYGRGISLLRGLCDQVTYLDTGNLVRVRYVLGELEDSDCAEDPAENKDGLGATPSTDDDLTLF